jgi:F0F1-type ATP synthase epsilon subunit
MAGKNVIKLKVRDTQNIVFEGEVDRITSYNEVGTFDIYPMHANFISILRKQIDLYNNHKKIKEIKIEQAVMKIKQDVASIYLGIEALSLDEKTLGLEETEIKKK